MTSWQFLTLCQFVMYVAVIMDFAFSIMHVGMNLSEYLFLNSLDILITYEVCLAAMCTLWPPDEQHSRAKRYPTITEQSVWRGEGVTENVRRWPASLAEWPLGGASAHCWRWVVSRMGEGGGGPKDLPRVGGTGGKEERPMQGSPRFNVEGGILKWILKSHFWKAIKVLFVYYLCVFLVLDYDRFSVLL